MTRKWGRINNMKSKIKRSKITAELNYCRYPYNKMFIQPMIIAWKKNSYKSVLGNNKVGYGYSPDWENPVEKGRRINGSCIPSQRQIEWLYAKAHAYKVDNLEEIKKDYPNGQLVINISGPIMMM